MSWKRTPFGFAGVNVEVSLAISNDKWGDVIHVKTPSGLVEVYVTPKGRKTRIFLAGKELDK